MKQARIMTAINAKFYPIKLSSSRHCIEIFVVKCDQIFILAVSVSKKKETLKTSSRGVTTPIQIGF